MTDRGGGDRPSRARRRKSLPGKRICLRRSALAFLAQACGGALNVRLSNAKRASVLPNDTAIFPMAPPW
jgi:hypothetical protein